MSLKIELEILYPEGKLTPEEVKEMVVNVLKWRDVPHVVLVKRIPDAPEFIEKHIYDERGSKKMQELIFKLILTAVAIAAWVLL